MNNTKPTKLNRAETFQGILEKENFLLHWGKSIEAIRNLRIPGSTSHQVHATDDNKSAEGCVAKHHGPWCQKDANSGIIRWVIQKADANYGDQLQMTRNVYYLVVY